MPLYEFTCKECGKEKEIIHYLENSGPFCCGKEMTRKVGLPAFFRMKGQGYPSRKRWMDNWTPDSKPFPTVSVHGERY
jgi:putative FmdB family regulatory protein